MKNDEFILYPDRDPRNADWIKEVRLQGKWTIEIEGIKLNGQAVAIIEQLRK